MIAKRAFTLNRNDGTSRTYGLGDEIEDQDLDHWYVHGRTPPGVREEMLSRIPAAGSVAADPDNPLGGDKADGPARDPADMHARMTALEDAHANHMDAVNRILTEAGLTDAAKSLTAIPQADGADAGKGKK